MILLVDNGSSSIINLIEKIKFIDNKIRVIKNTDVNQVEKIKGIILSGRSIYSAETNRNNFKIIRKAYNSEIPILGICFGAEILAATFRGTLQKMERPIKEYRRINIIKENKLIKIKSFRAFESHGYKIFRLPKDFERIGVSEVSENEVIKHREKQIYGVQFHPEISGRVGLGILKNFIGICNLQKKNC